MSNTVIKVENVSKQYRLGEVGTGSLVHDLNSWWHKVRGKENPYLKIGEANDRTVKGNSDYVWALQDINFEVKQGEVLGIIGRNGAGKSTLLKILSKTTAPTTGSVKIKGRIASLLEVGTGFHPDLSGRDNIFLNGAILGMSKQEIKKKFDEIVDFAGVERYIDTPVKRYSSGMYVRLAFAVAAHLEPEILIVDEVLAVGDAEFQKKCIGKMKDVSVNDGRTVLFVSHNMAAVSTLCTKGLLMQHGTVLNSSDIKPIIDQYIILGKERRGEVSGDEIVFRQTFAKGTIDAIRIKANGETTSNVAINEEISIEIEFTIFQDGAQVYPSIILYNNMDIAVLGTFNAPSASTVKDEFYGVPLKTGKYISVCKIPGNFLNDIDYSISAFLVGSDFNDTAIVDGALNFSVTETGEMRKEYNGVWVGMVRPKFFWETKKK